MRRAVMLPAALLTLAGCGRDVEVRTYREVTIAPTAVGALFDSTGADAGARAGTEGDWLWVTPSEWSELPGDGLRVARFGLPGGGQSTVVVLAGDAGGVEANVRRWLTQLGLSLPADRLRTFLSSASSVRGGLDFAVFDFIPLVAGRDDTAFLTGIASDGGQTLFVKAEAPARVLAGQRDAFADLLISLRPRSADDGDSAYGD